MQSNIYTCTLTAVKMIKKCIFFCLRIRFTSEDLLVDVHRGSSCFTFPWRHQKLPSLQSDIAEELCPVLFIHLQRDDVLLGSPVKFISSQIFLIIKLDPTSQNTSEVFKRVSGRCLFYCWFFFFIRFQFVCFFFTFSDHCDPDEIWNYLFFFSWAFFSLIFSLL